MRIASIVISFSWLLAAVLPASAANIVHAGKLSCKPALDPKRLQRLTDGSKGTGIAFPVGSKGEGAFSLAFARPHRVSGIRFYQTSPVYFTTEFRVDADTTGDGAFDAVLFQGKAAEPEEWTEAKWDAVQVHALRLASVRGVSKGRRAHPCIGEIEVLGEPLPTDNADARSLGNPVSRITRVREIDRWIDLSGRTRPVAVLVPKGDPWRKAGDAIAATLAKRNGKRAAVTTDPAEASPETRNVIALGNVNNNELIARLYWNHYAYADSLLPGPTAYSLRTVYDPYPWHGKGDVVVLGASDAASAGLAAQAFAERIEERDAGVGIGYTLVVSSAPKLTQAANARLEKKTAPSFRVWYESASAYMKTGDEAYARHAIATLDRIVELYKRNPGHDCDWPEETTSDRILATWDAFEECPLIASDERRLAYTLAFLKFTRALQKHCSRYSSLGKGDLVTWNHTTFSLLGMYFGARYFWDYYGLTEMEERLRKADACMTAQAKSWKPQEDADSYHVITMRHAIDYCLAEWRTDLLKKYRMIEKHADYVIGVCDSRGWPSGFGDSGIGVVPSLIKGTIPKAFWWTRDAGYLWVLEHTLGDKWQNPLHRDVEQRKPLDQVGVRVFPLDKQLYEYTRLHSYYNEPKSPPNVRQEEAFDKIAFRASWDQDAQYMLLDGFARGKHLHYDGNAIIELVDRGYRWLLDHDYLTRNTTEHNMLSVLRDGRSNQLMPSCAALRCAGDVGGKVGLVSTEVRDYTGIDWRRDIFWLKGEWFAVMDRMTARAPGQYDLDLVWKTENRKDEWQKGQEFLVRRAPGFGRTNSIAIVRDAQAAGGRAVLFGSQASALTFVVDLPAGEYALGIRGYGIDGSSDSLFASTGVTERVACHLPKRKYGPASSKFDLTGKTPRVKFAKAGRQLITLTLRERPPVRVDTISLASLDGKQRVTVQAEDAPQPTLEDLKGLAATRFHITWPDAVAARMTTSTPPGIVVPVRKLWQRWSGALRKGEGAEIANVLYCDDSAKPADLRIRRVAKGAVLIDGEEPTLCAVRGANLPGLEFDAEMLWLSPSRLAWARGQSLRVGPLNVLADQRGNVEIAFAEGKVMGGEAKVSGWSREALHAWLAGLGKRGEAKPIVAGATPPSARVIWQKKLNAGGPVRRIRMADVNGDGVDELVVAVGQNVVALTQDGKELWRYTLAGECTDVACGDLKPEAGLETVAACANGNAYLIDSAGKLISKQAMLGPAWNQNFGERRWSCLTALVADLDQDGKNEIVVGTQSYELRIYDADWRLKSTTRKAVYHGSLDFQALDANGDGKLEIFTTDRYGFVAAYDSEGKVLTRIYTSIGDMQMAVADLDGDGNVEVVAGSSTGDMLCRRLVKGKKWAGDGAPLLWRFDNFGYGVNRLRAADIDGDGQQEVIVASQTGYLYVLSPGGKVKWQDRAGADVVEVVVLADGPSRLAYFDRDGVVTFASGDGAERVRVMLPFQPLCAMAMGSRVVVGGKDVVAVVLPPR